MITDFTPFIHWLRWFFSLFGLKRRQLPQQTTLQKIGHRQITNQNSNPANQGILVGRSSSGIPVHWPVFTRQRAGHAMVLASSGAGKTILTGFALVSEFLQSLSRGEPNTLVVVDPKGDLVKIILDLLCLLDPERLSRVTLLDPFKYGFPFNLNKLDRSSNTPLDIFSSQLAHLVGDVSSGTQRHLGVGMRQIDLISQMILASLDSKHEKANVLWGLDALIVKNGLKILAGITNSARARQFLLSVKINDELRASCGSRLRTAFGASESLERMVSSPNCIQLGDLLSSGSIVLIDLGDPTGGLISLQEFWANMLIRVILDNLMQRPSPWSGHHCRIAIDEAQVVAEVLSDTAERVLTTGRSRGVSLTILSQGTTLLKDASDTLLKVLFTNCPTKFIGRLAAQDADLLAKEQSPGLGIDESISSVRSRLVASITNLEDRDFYYLAPSSRQRFRTANVEVERAETTAQNMSAELEAVKTRLAIPRDQPPRVTLDQIKLKPKPRPRKKIVAKPKKPVPSKSTKPPVPKNSKQKNSPPADKPKRRPRSPWG